MSKRHSSGCRARDASRDDVERAEGLSPSGDTVNKDKHPVNMIPGGKA